MQGVWTAIVTPFTNSNDIDLSAYKKLLKTQVASGITGIVTCGSTGEAATLNLSEKKLLIETTLSELKGTGVKVVAGTGTNNTRETQEFSSWASERGVDGVLVVNPYYNKPSQSGLEAHFRAVADAVNCEVTLYNHPGRTAIALTAETIGSLSTHPKINSIKDSCGQVSFVSDIQEAVSAKGGSLDILSGDDANFLPMLSLGAVGLISVAANLFPQPMVQLYKEYTKGNSKDALSIHNRYYPLFRDLFIETNPVPMKHALAWAGWCEAKVRLPLTPISSSSMEKLVASLIKCGISQARPT